MNDNRNTPESSPRTVQRSGTTSHGSVPAGLIREDYVPKRSRGDWGRAGVLAAVACLAWLAWPTAAFAQEAVEITSIAGDNKVNASEHSAGFKIIGTTKGDQGTPSMQVPIGNIDVTVTIDGTALNGTSSNEDSDKGVWEVTVPGNADYIGNKDGQTVSVEAEAMFGAGVNPTATASFDVDLTAPTISYDTTGLGLSLKVGMQITALPVSTDDTSASYSVSTMPTEQLPPGLMLNQTTGAITGTPTTASSGVTSVVKATDSAGNEGTASVAFPKVDKGDQTLVGFGYTLLRIRYKDTAPMVIEPPGARTPVTYSASPATVCSVDSSTGALTIKAGGTCTITASVADDDDNYNAAADETFALDVADVVVSWTGSLPYLLVPEESSVSYTVKLATQPTHQVTITVDHSGDENLMASPDKLIFTTSNWQTAQTVTVSAVDDDDGIAGIANFSHNVASTDSIYDGIGAHRLEVHEDDNDTPGVTVSPTTVTVREGGSAKYTLVLNTPPSSNVTITVSQDDTPDQRKDPSLEVTPNELTFTTSNWSMSQTVTVSAAEDDDTLDGRGNFSHSVASLDEDYTDDELTINPLRATERDNDKVAQMLRGFTYNGSDRATVTYGDDPLELTPLTGARTEVTYSSSNTDVCTFDSSTSKLTIVGVGTCTITAEAARTATHKEASVTFKVTVNQAGQTLRGFTYNGSDRATVTYGDDPLELTPLTGAVGEVTYSATPAPVCTVDSDSGALTIVGGGTCAIMAEAAGDANYEAASVTFNLTVAKADQTLEGFAYSASQVNFGTTPTVTAPSGARTEVTYAATPAPVCTVDSDSGALTIAGGGTCAITASAAATDDGNYNAGTATFSVKVLVEGLTLRVDKIAGDNIINEKEKHDGFTISSNTGTESGVTVKVTIGGTELPSATLDANGNWSVSVPEDAMYITQPSVWVLVTATHPNGSPTLTVSRELVVDLRDLTNLQVPMKVTDFRVAVADADTVAEDSYVLSWEDPGDATIIRYEYRWDPRASWSEWTDIPRNATTSYTVVAAEAGLDLNTAYKFQIRARNANGAGLPSEYAANALLLPVSFGAAAYKADEGGAAATVTVTLSWPATKKLTIPIRVTAGTAEAGDYMVEVIPDTDDRWHAATRTVTLTFDGSEANNTKTFTITARDETDGKDFDDGTVRLSFGELPGGVIAGTPATATLTIIDDEGAVVQARFRRLNNEILSKHALTLADVTIAAVTSRQEAGPRCADQATTGSLGGQSSLAEILTSNAQTLNTGSLNLKQLLGTSAFRLRLTEDGSGAGPGCLTLWGQGDYRNLSSSDAQGLEWDGDLVTGQVGADALLQPDLRAGLAVSWSEGDFDYTDRTDGDPFSGDYTSRMMSVHPYLTWWSPAGLDVWATGGYGQGEIEIKDEEAGTHTSDTTLRLASVGASGLLPIGDALIAGGTTTLRVKAQASVAQMKVEGNGSLLEEQTIEAQRLRLALEGSHERPLASGGSLTPSFEVGLRHDGGDGATGTGLELGGGLRYVNPALGLTVEGRGRVLAAYEENYEEWGASGLIRLDPGIDRQGLSFSLVPSYGQTASGVQRLWDQGLPQGSPQGAPTTQAPTGRLEAEVGYGLVAFAGQGLVTPYSAVMLGGGTQQYRVGSRLELGPALRLSLEGTRQVTTVGQADQGIRLQVDWRF